MSYRIEIHTPGVGSRSASEPTVEAAKAHIVGFAPPVRAVIYRSDEATFGEGEAVAVFDIEEGWLDADNVKEPAWWAYAGDEAWEWLRARPGEPLPPSVARAVTQAGGLVVHGQWSGSEPSGPRLFAQDEAWVRFAHGRDGSSND